MDPSFLIPEQWQDYELLDSGDGMKLERWGSHILIRPDSEAYWPRHNPSLWKKYDACFSLKKGTTTSGQWKWQQQESSAWNIAYKNLSFSIHPTTTKQVGLFPEQACNWDWCSEQIIKRQHPQPKVLNLFGYTGAASIAAAKAGASVCHVDSSKAAVQWCSQNAALSGIDQNAIRFIVDDCSKFIAREQRRHSCYDAIILDPPTFGRGKSGEIWRLEDQLENLLSSCLQLLTPSPLFLLLNTYSPALSCFTLQKLFLSLFKKNSSLVTTIKPLALRGTHDGKILPCGITSRILWKA